MSMPFTLCVLPKLESLAGPASFYGRFTKGARARGVVVHNDPVDPNVDAILVIAGTRYLGQLWRAKRRGIRIVQRLDGINWLHRRIKTGWKHYLRSEINNLIMAVIRKNLADFVVYQSGFVQDWWEMAYGPGPEAHTVIFNGIDLNEFSPEGTETPPSDHVRMLVIEGRLGGGQEKGLENAIHLARMLNREDRPVELMVVSRVDPDVQAYWEQRADTWINWRGPVRRDEVPGIDRGAHFMFSADLNAPCPNAVVEALACGLPVVSFVNGALPEMVQDGAGVLSPYGADIWKLEDPDFEGLAAAAEDVIANQEKYRAGARRRAEAVFDMNQVVDRYLAVIRQK
ncbi:MAG: glycosyltransferase family 4 protein [Anaerolineaceae bacterium]|nr:glycosyltransferase family 4 protein [Anaerolineaceae bacterium]